MVHDNGKRKVSGGAIAAMLVLMLHVYLAQGNRSGNVTSRVRDRGRERNSDEG